MTEATGQGTVTTRLPPERAREKVTPSEAVVARVARAKSVDPTDLPPLYWTIDPEALDELTADGSATVEFDYAGYTLAVTGGTVTILD